MQKIVDSDEPVVAGQQVIDQLEGEQLRRYQDEKTKLEQERQRNDQIIHELQQKIKQLKEGELTGTTTDLRASVRVSTRLDKGPIELDASNAEP